MIAARYSFESYFYFCICLVTTLGPKPKLFNLFPLMNGVRKPIGFAGFVTVGRYQCGGENQSKLVILVVVGNLTQCLLISTPLKAEYLNAPHRLV